MEDDRSQFGDISDLDASLNSTRTGAINDPSLRLDLSTVWMEKSQIKTASQIAYKIPCLFIPYGDKPLAKVAIFFHSNAEDINASKPLCTQLSESLQVSIIAVEYPGYGYYVDFDPSEEQICSDALKVYDFLIAELRVSWGSHLY